MLPTHTYGVTATMGMARVFLCVLDSAQPVRFVFEDIGTPMPPRTWNMSEFFGHNVSISNEITDFIWDVSNAQWIMQSTDLTLNYFGRGICPVRQPLNKDEHIAFLRNQWDTAFFLTFSRQIPPAWNDASKRPLRKRARQDLPCWIQTLPREMVIEIFGHLTSSELYGTEYVCKEWCELARRARKSLVICHCPPDRALARYANLRSVAGRIPVEHRWFGSPVHGKLTTINFTGDNNVYPTASFTNVRKTVLRNSPGVLRMRIPASTEHLVLSHIPDERFLIIDEHPCRSVTRFDLFGIVHYNSNWTEFFRQLTSQSPFPSLTTITWNNIRSDLQNDTTWLRQYPRLKRWSLNHCMQLDFGPLVEVDPAGYPQLERLYLHYCGVVFTSPFTFIPAFATLRYLLFTPLCFAQAVGWHFQDLVYLEEFHLGYSNPRGNRNDDFWLHLAKVTSQPSLKKFVCFNLTKGDVHLSPESERETGNYAASTRVAPIECVLSFQDFPGTGEMAPLTMHLNAKLTSAFRLVVKKGQVGNPCLSSEDYDMVYPQFLARREFE